jgi:FkbM family methyltransferase
MFKEAAHLAYKKVPFKRELFTGLRKIWNPPQKLYRHLSFQGPFSVNLGTRSFQVMHYGYEFENSIFWSGLCGDWEGQSMSLWIQLCQFHEVIYDIGANTGVFALVAKTLRPAASVHAFEPVKRVFQKLSSNNQLNGFDIHCVDKALSDQDGIAKIFDQPTEHIYSVTVNRNLSVAGTNTFEVEIETQRIDTYFQSLGPNARPPTLIKLDVETHEPEVLIGMGDLLRSTKPDFLIEILNEDVATRVEKLVENLGYQFYNIDEVGKPKKQNHLGKSDHWNFLICQPETSRKLGL